MGHFCCFYCVFHAERKKISNRLRSMCLSRPNQLKLASIIFFAFFSRIPKYFYRHFLLVVDVAVEVAVEWLLNSTASGSRTLFGFYCHWKQNRFSILLPIFNGSRSGSRNGSRISKWQQKTKWQQKSRASPIQADLNDILNLTIFDHTTRSKTVNMTQTQNFKGAIGFSIKFGVG